MIKLDGKGLVPAIVQDADTGQVLMLGYGQRPERQGGRRGRRGRDATAEGGANRPCLPHG